MFAPRPLAEPAPRSLLHPGEQRPVTLVVLDLALHGGEAYLPPETLAQLSGPLAEAIAGEFTCRGARVLHREGGRMIAVFGWPEVREDDAELAATAALAADRRRVEAGAIFDDVGCGVTGRAGVHAGFAALSEEGGAPAITGEALEIAVHLAEQAPLNGVLLSDAAVAQLPALFATRPLGELHLQSRRLLAHELLGGDSAPWSEIAASAQMSRRGQAGPAAFVGRAAELDALTAALTEVRERGGPGLALVVGGAGLGKTRMVTELCARLAVRGRPPTPVVRVVPPPREPYGLWASVLRAFLDPRAAADDESLRESLAALGRALDPERRAALLRQQPVIAMLLGGGLGGLAEENSPQAVGNRIQTAVTLCLTAAARRAAPHPGDPPLLVALDDVHRADDASLAILGPVLAALRAPLPLLVIVTAREGAALDLRGLPQQSAPIVLGPLDDGDAAALCRALAGGLRPGLRADQLGHAPDPSLSPAACEFVVKRAAGSPLFIEELIPALRSQGLLGAHAERLSGFLPPASLYALLFGRLDRLDAGLREMLRIASALGAEFERPLFEAVVEAAALQDSSLLAGTTPRAALDDLTRREFLSKSGDVYGFRQAQLQGAVYGTILAENKRALHLLAAEALERLHEGRLDRYLSRLLLHYSRTEDVAKTVRYARLAGLNAYGIGAYEEASDDLMMAAALQDQIAEADPLPAPHTLLDLARAYQWSGRFAQADAAAAEAASRLAQIAGASPAAPSREAEALRAEICWTRGYVAEFRSRWDAALGFFEEAERAFADARRPFDAARVRCHRGFVLRSAGRLTEGMELSRDGWEVLRGSGNLAAVAHAGHDLGNVLRDLGQGEEARRIFDVAVAAGDELWRRGNTLEGTWGALAARSGRGMARAVAGDLDAAVADQRTVIALADQEGHRIAAAFASSHLAAHLLERGDLAEAEAAAARAHALSVELSMPSRAFKCRLTQARIAHKQGRAEQALAWLEEAESMARRDGLGDDAWFDVAERLVTALGPDSLDTSPGVPRLRSPAGSRVDALAAEGEARAKRSGQPRHRERAAALAVLAGIFQGEVK
jgi:tetratricopeptide (TPR) repeat protein